MATPKEAPVEKSVTVEKPSLSVSEVFVQRVTKEFTGGVGGALALTDFQNRLAQNYFITVDSVLKAAEEKRRNKKKNQDQVPVTWQNVNMEQLARNVVSAARIGFDPAQKNHINMIPYKNKSTGKYDIGFIEGYRGMELKAKKYGLDVPDGVIVELVYSSDKFKSIKKDRNNKVESFEFEIVNDFDRGEIVGGFYYHFYIANPEKNKLVVFNLKDIEKRKPQYASTEFWGGKKDKWENGQVVGTEEVEGWYDIMCLKTIYRAAYANITIDSQKIDNDYMTLKQNEQELKVSEIALEIAENANSEAIDVEPVVTVEADHQIVTPVVEKDPF
jgi:recombination protein RecT